MADLVDRIREELRLRLDELRPAVQEHEQLDAALHALGDKAHDDRTRTAAPKRRRRQSSAPAKPATPARRQRRSRPRAAPGANRDALLRAVQDRPGASSRELAIASGIQPSSVSRLLSRLVRDGQLQAQQLPSGRKGYAMSKSEPAGLVAAVPTEPDQSEQPIPATAASEAGTGVRAPE